jgi:hypothetical protein
MSGAALLNITGTGSQVEFIYIDKNEKFEINKNLH